MGDVVEESDGDLMGDGVNIAAGLEGICQPGAICLSEDAWIPARSATRLREADLNVLSKLGKQGLEWRLEPEAFAGGEVGREDDVLDVLVGCAVDIEVARHRRKRPLAFSTPPFCHEA